jgi:hypothetical protein
MDSEAAVIRSEMSQTKAELDYKISQLQRKTHAMMPRALASRFMPERALGYAIGSVLTLVGARIAWRRFRARRSHRQELRRTLAASQSR